MKSHMLHMDNCNIYPHMHGSIKFFDIYLWRTYVFFYLVGNNHYLTNVVYVRSQSFLLL
jgi:hypothetical protein